MSGRRRRPRKGSDVVPLSPHSEEDLQHLDAFCRNLHIDEVSFDDWAQTHNSLDLTIPLTISRADLHEGGKEVTIQWTRSIQERPGGPAARAKESKSIIVSTEAKSGDVMVLKDLGDQVAEDRGDLKIIIHVK